MMTALRRLLLMDQHVCPWWFAYAFDNPVRRLFHDPEKMLSPYLRKGMGAIDVGCGMGSFSIAMARLVGEERSLVSVDLQQEMLMIHSPPRRKIPPGGAERPHLPFPF